MTSLLSSDEQMVKANIKLHCTDSELQTLTFVIFYLEHPVLENLDNENDIM